MKLILHKNFKLPIEKGRKLYHRFNIHGDAYISSKKSFEADRTSAITAEQITQREVELTCDGYGWFLITNAKRASRRNRRFP